MRGAVKNIAVVLMAKQPAPGRTKTRLCPPLTPQSAARLYEAMLQDTILLASTLREAQLVVALTPPESRGYFEEITPGGTLLLPIEGPDIGVCLERTFYHLFTQGFQQVIALNTDGPALPPDYLTLALSYLAEHDMVLGPGEDGGYYLIGLNQPRPALFEKIAWSTDQVLAQTVQRAGQLGLRCALTPPWYDVDTPADLQRVREELADLPPERLPNTRRFFEHDPHLNPLL